MSWQKHTIKLGTAQRIFPQFNIQEMFIGERSVGYEAIFQNHYRKWRAREPDKTPSF